MTQTRTVRIFLSSTFRDFRQERDLLVKRVFPSLRAKLRERFVELVDVDLRWGITPQEAERGEVLPICLSEIDRARPYFIGMLGERYGWIPPPEGYAADLLERQPWLKRHLGGTSVTELEILYGVLNRRRMQGRAFFYFRSRAYALAQGGDYLPAPGERARQAALKRRIRERGLPVTRYADPEALARRIERDLWTLLDAQFPAVAVPDAFERERLRHEAYASSRRHLYLDARKCRAELESALEAQEPRILIEGVSGSGKSALLANFLDDWRGRHSEHRVHVHHLDAGDGAADPYSLVRRLVESIKRHTASPAGIPTEPQALMDSLPAWLATAGSWALARKARFICVLDAIDSLSELQDLRWWPERVPAGVTLIVSCHPGAVRDDLKTKTETPPGKRKPRPWKVITVAPLTRGQSAALLAAYLGRFNKKLPDSMFRQVQAHALATNPLFMATLAEELRLFGVHEQLQERLDHYLASQTIDDLFERVLRRVEGDHGRMQVQAALSAIWVSRSGLTEKEILQLADLTPALWAGIRHALGDGLVEIAGHVNFSYPYLRVAVGNAYLGVMGSGSAAQRTIHRKLCRYFIAKVDPEADGSFSGEVASRGMDVLYHAVMSGDARQTARFIGRPDAFYRLVALPRLSGEWDIVRRAADLLRWAGSSVGLDPDGRLQMRAKVLTACLALAMGLLGRCVRYLSGQSDSWETPVGIHQNEALGREAVVAMAAAVRWWMELALVSDEAACSPAAQGTLAGILSASRSGLLDDLDSHRASLLRERLGVLNDFVRSRNEVSRAAVDARLAFALQLDQWTDPANAQRLRDEASAIARRLVPSDSDLSTG